MPHRGATFWLWADCELHHRTHTEVLDDGTIIDVQTRLSRKGITQLFVGVYSETLRMLHEEAYTDRAGETMTAALSWGVEKARAVAVSEGMSKGQIRHGLNPHTRRPRAT